MTRRRGSALLLVLWLLVLLAGVVALGLGGARTGTGAARNRLALLRAGWAREACLEILRARARGLPEDSLLPRMLRVDSVDLGQGIWCEATVEDPGERLQLNRAAERALAVLFGDSAVAGAVVAGRPWPAVEALPAPLARWAAWLTVRGVGLVNLNAAPREVLATLPGVGPDGAAALAASRAPGRPLRSIDEAIAALPEASRVRVLARYDQFAAAITFRPSELVVIASGHAGGGGLATAVTATLVPAGGRLAVIRREAE